MRRSISIPCVAECKPFIAWKLDLNYIWMLREVRYCSYINHDSLSPGSIRNLAQAATQITYLHIDITVYLRRK